MRKSIYEAIVKRIEIHEFNKVTLKKDEVVEEALKMISFLNEQLNEMKTLTVENGFINEDEEIYFFKHIKPQILGKLIFYNKIFRIETSCLVKNGTIYYRYFEEELEKLDKELKEYFNGSEFYRYFRAGRTDLDLKYFRLGQIDFMVGLKSFVFEIDPQFSTYYDYKVARIIADDLLYNYIQQRLNPDKDMESTSLAFQKYDDMFWTDSKNALIELIYALYAARSLSNGRLGISKLSTIAQSLFQIELGDLHHAFHRMKVRAGSKTSYLDYLKDSLEQYMNKNL